jgi:type IV pilus assembly protein PilY1
MTMFIRSARLALALAAVLATGAASAATTYTDNFSGSTAALTWQALNYACLTAGNGSGSIPACSSKNPKGPQDAVGQGALRLTPAANTQTGAILSGFAPFPLSQGIQVTFTTYTYGGTADGPANNGADGLTFFLTDGSAPVPKTTGASGGAMGYDCSNTNDQAEGMANAYIGLGVDEWGNYLNPGDNGRNGVLNSRATGGTTAYGDNPFQSSVNGSPSNGSGKYYQPERIGMRGAGNLTWAWLQAQNKDYYSGTTTNSGLVQAVCKSGQYVSSGKSAGQQLKTIPYNYDPIPGAVSVLPASQPIANNSTAATRNPPAGTAACVGNNPVCKTAWPITYKLTISPSGLLNFSYSYNNGTMNPVLVNTDITKSNGPLPPSLRFGFSAGTGGSNNVHEITCFQASPLQANSSAAANTIQTGEVKTGTQVYLASYSADNWWGSLQAMPLVTTGGTLSVSSVANWDAKCTLTGGPCDSLGTDANGNPKYSVTVQGPTGRNLLSWSGTAGIPLQWTNLSSSQQTALNSTDSAGQSRLKWLRGDRTVEQLQSPPGNLRARNVVLGDIIDSSPTWVGAPYPGTYPNAFSDGLYGNTSGEPENQTGAQTFSTFVNANVTRTNVVYVGGNDGLLHGFRSGAFKADGSFDGSNNDGKELIGYMPAGVLTSKAVALASPTYGHDYLVDATPAVGDLFYGGSWHTWLVGGVGSSGKEVFALDITNPANFGENNAASLVKGDWTNASTGLSKLGNSVGTPIITRMHNGQWAIIFGNGFGSGGSAGVYIGLVDKNSGAVTFQFLDTGVGSSTTPNGIAYVTSVDLDGDHIADYLYAGDLRGNVWRFDVTSSSTGSWTVSKFGNSVATPLYVAKDAAGNLQPITTGITVAAIQTSNATRTMLYFGTGQKTPADATHGDTYASGKQTFYGLWDWDMGNWNKLSSVKYAALTGTQNISRANFLVQTLASPETAASGNGQVLGYRMLRTGTVVCWQGSSTCASGNTQFGWLFDLPDAGEQIVYNPEIIDGAVVVSTAIPPVVSAIQCNAGTQTGWTMAFDPLSGGGLPQGFFPNASGAFGTNSDGSTVSGVQLNAVGTPAAVNYNGQIYMVTQTVKGTAALNKINPPSGNNPSRVSWREVRY